MTSAMDETVGLQALIDEDGDTLIRLPSTILRLDRNLCASQNRGDVSRQK